MGHLNGERDLPSILQSIEINQQCRSVSRQRQTIKTEWEVYENEESEKQISLPIKLPGSAL